MSGFQVGDVVVCVDASLLPQWSHYACLEKNRYYRVIGLRVPTRPELAANGKYSTLGLFLDGVRGKSPTGSFASFRFRKIRPADEQFTASIRACKPQRVGEPA